MSPWANNWGINDVDKPTPKWMHLSALRRASELMSVYDCAQGWNGIVPTSGAGAWISHGPNIWDQPAPGPSAGQDPDTLIGIKDRPAQNGVEYWRGCVDFRHPAHALNAALFDGHVQSLRNGRIRMRNVIHRFNSE